MFDRYDPRDDNPCDVQSSQDPRDRDNDVRDIEMPWIELSDSPGLGREQGDFRDRDDVRSLTHLPYSYLLFAGSR